MLIQSSKNNNTNRVKNSTSVEQKCQKSYASRETTIINNSFKRHVINNNASGDNALNVRAPPE